MTSHGERKFGMSRGMRIFTGILAILVIATVYAGLCFLFVPHWPTGVTALGGYAIGALVLLGIGFIVVVITSIVQRSADAAAGVDAAGEMGVVGARQASASLRDKSWSALYSPFISSSGVLFVRCLT